MKTLILTLALLSSPLAQAASSVNVIIDGESYSCSKGGSGGGNQCECVVTPDGSRFKWTAFKRGNALDYWYEETREAAESRCKYWIASNSSCYQ
jgi:hypothetical protein